VEVEALFEGSSPLARRLREEGPHTSPEALLERARRLLDELDDSAKVETLNAHPRVGEDPARLSRLSLAEQGAERLPELARLNAEYEARFGFRFVIFVDGRSQAEVAKALRKRLANDRDQELASGLRAVVDIAGSRLARHTR
jgi:2-oxo-4-hydroxy-4-carboxy--5-ureidoimidazoline (OHCU) decarboxylase